MAYNDGKLQAVALNTGGALDTAHPPTDREPGTLVEALDLNHRYWGPKVGPKAYARVWESTGPAIDYDYFTFDGTNYGIANSVDDQFRDLPAAWTLDLFYDLTDIAYAAAYPSIGLYDWDVDFTSATTKSAVRVVILSNSTAFDQLQVTINPTSARATLGTARTLTATGLTALGQKHVRIVRDGANAYLYVDGTLKDSISTLDATQPHQGPLGELGGPIIGSDYVVGNIAFKGIFHAAIMRVGAFRESPIERCIPMHVGDSAVRHFVIGAKYTDSTNIALWDLSRYSVHAFVDSGMAATSGTDLDSPFTLAPVQGMGTVTLQNGRVMGVVIVGGRIFRSYLS